MTIKKQFNIGLLLILVLFFVLLSINFFAFQKIKSNQIIIENINKSAANFYEQKLRIDKYSRALISNDFSDIDKDSALSAYESKFVEICDENSKILSNTRNSLKSQRDKEILDNIKKDHEELKNVFHNIKQKFLSSKITQENEFLNISQISQKRENIKNFVFSGDFNKASSSSDFFFTTLSLYESMEKQEKSFLYNGAQKNDLDILLKYLSDIEKTLRKEEIFNENSSVFMEIVRYRNELDSFFVTNNTKTIDKFPLDLEIQRLDDNLKSLFFEEGYVYRLTENQKKELSVFLWIIFFLNIVLFLLTILLLIFFSLSFSKKIIKPTKDLLGLSSEIGNGDILEPRLNKAISELHELENILISLNNKFNDVSEDLNNKINEIKIKQNLESLIETLTDGILMYDKNKNIVLMNSSLKVIIGVDNDNISLENIYRILAKHNLEFHINLSLKTKDIYRIDDVEIFGKYFEIIITQVSDYSENIVGGVIIFHEKEKDLKYQSENNNNLDLKSLISTQFGTPLSYIKLFTELLSSGEIGTLNKEQNETILNINKSVVEMKKTIDKLKQLSFFDSHELEIKTEELVVANCVEEIIKNFCEERKVEKTNFIFRNLISEGMKINIDKSILKKSLETLFENALAYSREDNKIIEVELKELGFNYLISVKDGGIGIPEEEHDLIFEKFFRASNSIIKNSKGIGLSLYLSKKQLNATGAELFFETKEGVGSTFFIEIPKGGMR